MARNFLEYDYRQNTVTDVFLYNAIKYSDSVFLKHRVNDTWKESTWRETAEKVEALASWLINSGLQKGGMVSIYSTNRPEWIIADLAALSAACTDTAIYPQTPSQEAAHILSDSKTSVCFCEGRQQADSILLRKKDIPSLKKIVVFDDPGPGYREEMVITFEEALRLGKERLQKGEISERRRSVIADDDMTVVYSSGTTGLPKGVMLSNSNIMFTMIKYNMRQNLPDGHTALSLLPLASAAERIMGYYSTMLDGGTIAFSRGIEHLAEDLKEIKPDFAIYPPIAAEKIYSTITGKIRRAARWKQKLFERALETGKHGVLCSMEGKPLTLSLRLKYTLYHKLVFTRLRASTGLNKIGFIITGAPLQTEIHDFFWGMNIHARKCYGLTETSAILNVDGDPAVFSVKPGGSISPFPETEMKLTVDGEILAKGPQIMKGYFNRPQETQDMFTQDGWFRTGDTGSMDVHGFLSISDRKKDIIITSSGKKVPPVQVETAFTSHPLIRQTAVFGESKKFIAALIVPDFDNLRVWAAGKGIKPGSDEELVNDGRIIKVYEKIAEKINRIMELQEPVKKIKLLHVVFSYDDGEVTPALKLKRRNIMNNYRKEIEKLFAE